MSMLSGEFSHSIDSKGRLIIPVKFRDILGENFVITKGMDGCLFVYSAQAWEEFDEKLKALPLTNKSARFFKRVMVGSAIEGTLDKQGRVLISSSLREFASLEKDVVLAGVQDKVEIWSKTKWDEINEMESIEDLAASMEEFGWSI